MAQSASVFVIKVLLESIVKVILERLKFYHSEKYMPKDDIFLDKSCSGESPPCNGNGQCNHTTGLCTCNEGNQGSDCSGNCYKLWWITIMLIINFGIGISETMYKGFFFLKVADFPVNRWKPL